MKIITPYHELDTELKWNLLKNIVWTTKAYLDTDFGSPEFEEAQRARAVLLTYISGEVYPS